MLIELYVDVIRSETFDDLPDMHYDIAFPSSLKRLEIEELESLPVGETITA